MKKNNFYLTTTLPYVNADPHIGFALEIIQADVVARYHRLLSEDVFFNFGTDEHGKKIYDKAIEVKKDPKEYCDEYTAKFDQLKQALNLSYDNFIRTTDPHHIKAAQEFWKRCKKNGDIYKKYYKTKYCVGCELEKTDSDLVDGFCPIHPNKVLEIIEEENYFFRFSKYQKPLLMLYKSNPNFVMPSFRQQEITQFIKQGLQDFSISRLKSKMPWGIDVPDDKTHVMYVWFDALINYISAIGWPDNLPLYSKWWPVTQFAGKDNLRQQAAIWQAMLMSAKLPSSKQIFIHGFISTRGQRISKTLGNVIDPVDIVDKYGTDALRYYLLAKTHPFRDSDFTIDKFEHTYNADLANGLGNLVGRVAKLCETSGFSFKSKNAFTFDTYISKHILLFRFNDAIQRIWEHIKQADKFLDTTRTWEQRGDELKKSLQSMIYRICDTAYNLKPFLPETSLKILNQFAGPKIVSNPPLFPRLSNL